MDISDLSRDQAFLDGEKPATETLGVTDYRVDPGFLDRRKDLCGLTRVRGKRFLDEQIMPLLNGQHCRFKMKILVRCDNGCRDLGPCEQFPEVRRKKIGLHILGEFLADIRLDIAKADPADARIGACNLGPDTADGTAANYGQTDFLVLRWHQKTP